jgi:hypothetical protein
MNPSYVPNDPLFDLVRALVEVLRYDGQTQCDWFYEPAVDRWTFRRDGDALTITICGILYIIVPDWPTERGELEFAATCDL